MKSKVIYTVLFLLVAVWSPYGKAGIWNPDTDADLKFNLNFENDTNSNANTHPGDLNFPQPTTTDAVAGLVGTAYDYNNPTHDSNNFFHMWNAPNSRWRPDTNDDPNAAKMGKFVGDFRRPSDYNTGKIWDACVSVALAGSTIFDMGALEPEGYTRTFTFWFWPEAQTVAGTFIRHANSDFATYPNMWWEIRMYEGKISFIHKSNYLRMETVDTLADMGILQNTWHHVAVVYDRDTREGSQIFIDGVQVDRIVTSYIHDGVEVDPSRLSPVSFGAGDSEFDGMLDEFRMYHRILTPSEISILYQTDYKEHAFALNPFPNAEIVRVNTNLLWYPDPCATSQTLYFDDDSDVCNGPLYSVVNGPNDLNSVANATIGGPLPLNTTYYWAVDTNIGGIIKGSIWKFTTEDGKAYNPVPDTGTENIPVGSVNLKWTGTPSAASYDVYFAEEVNQSKVQNLDPSVKLASSITDTNYAVSASIHAENYYWRVVTKLDANLGYPDVNSVVWTFRTEPYPIVFNTDNEDVEYKTQIIPGYTCMVLEPNGTWATRSTGTIASDGVIIFDFNGFNYNNRYEIIVLPAYDDTNDINTVPTPLGIDVNGSFYFDGRMNISGADTNSTTVPKACCGGHRGAKNNAAKDADRDLGKYRVQYDGYHRYSSNYVGKDWYPTEPNGYFRYGEGTGGVPAYKAGGGGGYGGLGGDSGRGYFLGCFAGGKTYGDLQVPVPFGGSAGGYGSEAPAGPGGGGVEIIATGDVTLDSNSIIRADGSNVTYICKYPSGGGSGGSLRIISDANVTLKGIISVNGGKGGNGNGKANDTGGGGGGGRVAVFYKGTTVIDSNKITATGGAKGTIDQSTGWSWNVGRGVSEAGRNGTFFSSNGSTRNASAPTPKNGDKMAYNDGNGIALKWYSGYNKTDACDVVYFGGTEAGMTPLGLPVLATRGQHTLDVNATVTNEQTYYWKVRTTAFDGNIAAVDSNVWSFKVVGWQCLGPNDQSATDPNLGWDGWPEWDAYPMDCVINFNDFWYFAKDWRVDRGGESSIREYTNDSEHLFYYVKEWMECRGRTNGGCSGW